MLPGAQTPSFGPGLDLLHRRRSTAFPPRRTFSSPSRLWSMAPRLWSTPSRLWSTPPRLWSTPSRLWPLVHTTSPLVHGTSLQRPLFMSYSGFKQASHLAQVLSGVSVKPPVPLPSSPPPQLRRGRSAGLDPAHLGPQGLGGGHVAALKHPVI